MQNHKNSNTSKTSTPNNSILNYTLLTPHTPYTTTLTSFTLNTPTNSNNLPYLTLTFTINNITYSTNISYNNIPSLTYHLSTQLNLLNTPTTLNDLLTLSTKTPITIYPYYYISPTTNKISLKFNFTPPTTTK